MVLLQPRDDGILSLVRQEPDELCPRAPDGSGSDDEDADNANTQKRQDQLGGDRAHIDQALRKR